MAADPGAGAEFRPHPLARLFLPSGEEVALVAPFDPLPPGDGLGALLAVLGARGRAFRIGGTGALEAGDGAFETLTGGSLGQPRRVVRRQASWLASFAVNAGLFGIGPGVRVAVLGSFVHSLALYGALESLCLGASLHVLAGLRPDRQAQALAAHRVGVIYATPAQLRAVLASGLALPALSHVILGGARVDGALRAALGRLAPQARLTVFYGAAETSFITLAGPESTAEGVGQPYPGVRIRIGEEGLIWVQSPYLFQSYAGTDGGGALWDGDWLTVGEVGAFGPEGLLLRGRAGRMVTVADQNVFPEEIEAFLETLPAVTRAAVLPVEDAARGHVLVAHLQGDAGAEGAILGALRRRLGPMIAPRALIWHEAWPMLPSGKTDLAALARRGVTRRGLTWR